MSYKILYVDDTSGEIDGNTRRLIGQLIQIYDVNCPNIYQESLNIILEKYDHNYLNIDRYDLVKYTEKSALQLCEIYAQFKPDVIIAVGLGSLVVTQMLDVLKCRTNIIFIRPVVVDMYESLPKILYKTQTVWIQDRHDKTVNYKRTIQTSQKCNGTLILLNNSKCLESALSSGILTTLIESICSNEK